MDENGPEGGGLGYLLCRAAQAWRAEVADALRPHDVSPAQFLVLVALLRNAAAAGRRPPTQRQIGKRTGMDANTASQVMRSLTVRGLIERVAHPDDGRALALSLTPQGTSVTHTCSTLVRAVNRHFFASVAGSELAHALRTLIDSSQEHR